MDRRKSTPWTPGLGYGANYSSRSPLYDQLKFNVARSRHLNKVLNSLTTCSFLRTSAVLGVREGRGSEKKYWMHCEDIAKEHTNIWRILLMAITNHFVYTNLIP